MVEFLQNYTFVFKYRAGIGNKFVDALSHLITILYSMQHSVIGFECLDNEYTQYPDFSIIYTESLDNLSTTQSDLLIREGYLL